MTAHLGPDRIEALAARPAEAEAHLDACGDCRDAVTAARGRQQLVSGLVPYTLSDMAFRRVEARLNEAIDLGLPPEPVRWRWVVWGAPVALAMTLVVLAVMRPEAPVVSPLIRPVVAVEAKAPWQPLLISQASGDAQQRPGHEAWAPVAAGAVLDENVAVSGSKVVLSAEGWAFEAGGSVSLGGPATVAVGAGTLQVQVQAPVVVIAGGVRLSTAEGAFFVSRAAAEVVVDVFDGQLEVGDATERLTVVGPTRVRWADGSPLRIEALGSAKVAIAVPRAPTVSFDVSALASGTSLEVDGQRLGETPLSVLLAVGRHRVLVTPRGQATRESWVDLVGGQPLRFHLPEVALVPKVERTPEVDSAALARVLEDLKRQTPKLRACYEKWLKANPSASGEVDLTLQVNAAGRVLRASVKGAPISQQSAECLVTTSRSLVLSPLGSMQELEVPLVLTPGR
jgi:hypothetical protein